jgi:hypothetical protein
MTLTEIFDKHTNDQKIYRTSRLWITPVSIEWAKGLKAWGNEESRSMGFWIPQFMLEDAEADDWELVNE